MQKTKSRSNSIKTIEYDEKGQLITTYELNENQASLGTLILAILLPLAIGIASATFSNDGMKMYKAMAKPPLAPPAIVFPIAWSALYVMMGIASYIVLITNAPDR